MSETRKKVAIIGSGPSGLTAAIYTSRADLDTNIYLGPQPGGQLTTTTEIENFPGFVDGIMGPDLMINMQKQAERFGAKTIPTSVQTIKKQGNVFGVETTGSTELYDAVIIASGASARYLGLPNEQKWIGKGYHSCATCDGFFYRGKVIAVAGGGDSAMEEAHFLTKFASKVYLIHRRDEFRASKIMIERVQNNPKIEMVLNTAINDFIEENDSIKGLKVTNTVTNESSEIALDGLFVAIGHVPNTGFVGDLNLSLDDAGYLIPQSRMPSDTRISKYLTMSQVEGIFIAGDVEDTIYRQAITAAGDGCKAAIDCEKWLES